MKNLFKTKNILFFFAFLLFGAIMFLGYDSFAGFIPSGAMTLGFVPLMGLQHDDESCNMAGISTIVYVARTKDVLTWPTVTNNPILPEDKVNLIGDFELNPGTYFYTFYSTQELGEFKADVAGPRDGEYFQITGNFFYPNTNARALGITTLLKNADVVIIVKEFSGSGQMRVIGSQELPARIKGSEASGKGFGDQKGITFNFDASSCTVPKVYYGDIITEDITISNSFEIDESFTNIDLAVANSFKCTKTGKTISIGSYSNAPAGSLARFYCSGDLSHISLILFAGAEIRVEKGNYAQLFFIQDNMPVVISTDIEV